jgi:hypothetical protein
VEYRNAKLGTGKGIGNMGRKVLKQEYGVLLALG